MLHIFDTFRYRPPLSGKNDTSFEGILGRQGFRVSEYGEHIL